MGARNLDKYALVTFQLLLCALLIAVSVKYNQLNDKFKQSQYNYRVLQNHNKALVEISEEFDYKLDLCKKVVTHADKTINSLKSQNKDSVKSEKFIYKKYQELESSMYEFAGIYMKMARKLQECEAI